MRTNQQTAGHGTSMNDRWLAWIAVLVLSVVGGIAHAAEFSSGSDPWLQEEPEFLSVDEAFVLSAYVDDNGVLQARWDMPDGYYLYRHQFAFESREPGRVSLDEPVIPAGKAKVDDFFGEVEVYYHSAEAAVALSNAAAETVEVGISYQGCADLGLCYPPETRWFSFDAAALQTASLDNGSSGGGSGASDRDPVEAVSSSLQVEDTQEQLLAGLLADDSLLTALGWFFVLGIGLAFTPCVLPMVPILSSIIVGQGSDISKGRAFSLSLAYVIGMAATYAAVGTLVGLFGAELNLQAALQSPPVLIVFALVFVLLSLSMFGFYELQLPQALQDRLNSVGQKQQGGKHASVMVMGALSSLVVSPCVSAPLAGALIYISTTGDALLGGTALLALGLGMGVPLMLVGGSGGHWLPRAGGWMNGVKAVFGVLLLGVAIWLLERVVPAAVTLGLWAALLLGSGVYLGVLDFAPKQGLAQFGKATGALGFLWGVLLLIGAASGANDPLKPLAPFIAQAGTAAVGGVNTAHAEPQWQAVKSLDDVRTQIALSNKPVILDLYADWCISCKTMERNVFPRPDVADRLNQFTLLRADVTDNDPVDRELLNHYGLFGPPSLVFFSQDGGELTEVRIQGEIGADALASHLSQVIASIDSQNSPKVGEIAAISR